MKHMHIFQQTARDSDAFFGIKWVIGETDQNIDDAMEGVRHSKYIIPLHIATILIEDEVANDILSGKRKADSIPIDAEVRLAIDKAVVLMEETYADGDFTD